MNHETKKAKFNIVDLVIVLVIVLAAAFVAAKLLHIGEDKTPLQKIQITFMEEECPNFVVDYTKVGDPLYDATEQLFLGTITDVHTEDAMAYTVDEETGYSAVGGKDNYCSVYITGEVDGTMTNSGALIGDVVYAPGHKLTLRAGTAKYYLMVYDVKVLD